MLAVVSPGQGSQKPGFLNAWLTQPNAESRLRWWSALAGLDLVRLGTEADADEIKDTARTQPLLVAAALLAAESLPLADMRLTHSLSSSSPAEIVAGHSVGELAAAAIAGVLTPDAAVTLAAVRGREMAAACAIEATSMAAILGGDEAEVLDAIAAAGLTPANRNGAGQIVAAGAIAGIEKLVAAPPARARIIPLSVAGAFHTSYMAPAETALAAVANGITPTDPTRILLSNLDGAAVTSGPEVLRRLVTQVTAPVRWDLIMATLADLGVTAIIELPPAGTLAGLAKRALKGVEIVTLNTPDDLPTARDLIAHHSPSPTHEPIPHFSVVVASTGGNFIPAEGVEEGADIKVGTVIGSITTRQGPVDVATHAAGVLTEWLAHHEDPVSPGQPLARIGGH